MFLIFVLLIHMAGWPARGARGELFSFKLNPHTCGCVGRDTTDNRRAGSRGASAGYSDPLLCGCVAVDLDIRFLSVIGEPGAI